MLGHTGRCLSPFFFRGPHVNLERPRPLRLSVKKGKGVYDPLDTYKSVFPAEPASGKRRRIFSPPMERRQQHAGKGRRDGRPVFRTKLACLLLRRFPIWARGDPANAAEGEGYPSLHRGQRLLARARRVCRIQLVKGGLAGFRAGDGEGICRRWNPCRSCRRRWRHWRRKDLPAFS